jgi:hypothetical protein
MQKIIENDKHIFTFNRKRIISYSKESCEEKIIFESQRYHLKLLGVSNEKVLFIINSKHTFILLNTVNEEVEEIKLGGYLTVGDFSSDGRYFWAYVSTPRGRICILDLVKSRIIQDKSMNEIGLRKPYWHTPRICFEVLSDKKIIIATYKSRIHIFDFNFQRILELTHSYPRTFRTAIDFADDFVNSTDLAGSHHLEIEKSDITPIALEFFGLEDDFTLEQLKKRYKELIRKYHPDINKENGSNQKTRITIEYYSILKKSKPSKKSENTENVLKNPNDKNVDWFSIVKRLGDMLYFGTYCGRIFGVPIEILMKIISKEPKHGEIMQTNIIFLSDFYFKTPSKDMQVVFYLHIYKNELIVKTSSNPFAKIDVRYGISEMTDLKEYKVDLKNHYSNSEIVGKPIYSRYIKNH